jgi:myosin heavy subunit
LLDEQCKLPKGTDKQFLFNVSSKLTGNNKLCNPGQFASEYFGVGHYAGNVFYNVNGFLEKNKDSLNPQLASALENSSVKLVKTLFVSMKDKKKSNAPGSLSALTLATQFKSQLQELIKALSGSTPTYIRCIKPNSQKLPKVIDSKDVQRQLRCAGMLECIRIRKAGYSVRRTVKEFVEKYSIIVPNFSKKDLNWSNLGKHLYEELRKVKKLKEILHPEKKLIQIGLTMVFMKDEVRQSLDKQYSKKASKFAIRIQKFIRMFRARRHYKLLQSSTKFLQKHIKDWLFSLKATRQLKLFKSLISTLSSKFLVKLKSNSLSTIKKFLQIASSKSYLSFFKPDRNRFRSSSFNKEENSRFSISSNFSSSKGKKQEISKELSQGQSSVIDTVQREVKTLSYLLQREKEKTRSVQEEANYYKELYNSTLAKLELAEREKTPKIDEEIGKNEEKLKKETKNLKKQLKEKNNEISMIQLKLESLKTNQLELEEVNKELKDKQGVWEQKLYSEMRKNALEVQELRCKIPQVDSEKVKSEKIVLEKEIRALKASLRQCENENSSLKSDLSESEMKIQDFQESEARLKDQIKSLQSQITSHSSSFSSFKEDSNSALLRKLSDLQKDYQKLKDDLEDSHDENENLQVELQKLHLSQEHFKQELSKNQKMNKEKNIKIKELENEVEALHHEKLELTRAKIELQTLKQKPSQDSENLQEMKLQIEELNQEIDDLIKELAAAKQIHGTLLTLVKIKNNELEVLKQSGNSDLMADLEYQEQGLLQE